MKKLTNIYDFDEFVNVINYKVKAFDFIEYPRGVSTAKYASGMQYLEDICVIVFREDSENMFWKGSFFRRKYPVKSIKAILFFFRAKKKVHEVSHHLKRLI